MSGIACCSRAAASCPAPTLRLVMMTRAPADASALTVCTPMPELPPVTTACTPTQVWSWDGHHAAVPAPAPQVYSVFGLSELSANFG